ncbi:MAG: DUF3175 domain-containing protein [Betaproteobacteria bacterium]|nr:MAG: DUF3175 domain-containing protein [Betaproteobacteria bacterium]
MSKRSRNSKKHAKSRKWSAEVARKSDALDIKQGTFASDDPRAIARSLKQSADHSTRRKSNPFRSALGCGASDGLAAAGTAGCCGSTRKCQR